MTAEMGAADEIAYTKRRIQLKQVHLHPKSQNNAPIKTSGAHQCDGAILSQDLVQRHGRWRRGQSTGRCR
jgi:hypothetical protein